MTSKAVEQHRPCPLQAMCCDYGFRSGVGRLYQGRSGEIPKNFFALVRHHVTLSSSSCTGQPGQYKGVLGQGTMLLLVMLAPSREAVQQLNTVSSTASSTGLDAILRRQSRCQLQSATGILFALASLCPAVLPDRTHERQLLFGWLLSKGMQSRRPCGSTAALCLVQHQCASRVQCASLEGPCLALQSGLPVAADQ